MVVDLIRIFELKGPYCTLNMTDWFLLALSVIPRGSWEDVSRRFTMIRWLYFSFPFSSSPSSCRFRTGAIADAATFGSVPTILMRNDPKKKGYNHWCKIFQVMLDSFDHKHLDVVMEEDHKQVHIIKEETSWEQIAQRPAEANHLDDLVDNAQAGTIQYRTKTSAEQKEHFFASGFFASGCNYQRLVCNSSLRLLFLRLDFLSTGYAKHCSLRLAGCPDVDLEVLAIGLL
ncbi:DEAD/DEAH box helicase [Dorcoceras hygrometricum]|uniref:DEAD/DEAH box helicase n=1 Tax=Dorcoceras hygrometricum TaxID=472368 RepID=A0A2Z7ANG5_9LAMI|nr:DEAD/DEAH box helicase [Dorcoceras hygrometricum]